jgi:hypothetical protein
MEENTMYVKALKPIIFLVTVLVLVSLACLGSETPTPEPPAETEAPQQPAQPQETEAPAQPSAQEFFTEEFDAGNDNWTYFVTKNDTTADDSGAAPITENGFLIFDLKKYLNVYAMYDPYTYDNVRIDVRVDNRGTNNNNINLICRYSDEGWYEIAIANNGLYWLYAFDGIKGGYAKIADGGSNKIKPGKEVNEYSFVCNDRNLVVYVNGNEVRTYTDNLFVLRRGQVGVGASSFKDLPVKVEFDWVKISQP